LWLLVKHIFFFKIKTVFAFNIAAITGGFRHHMKISGFGLQAFKLIRNSQVIFIALRKTRRIKEIEITKLKMKEFESMWFELETLKNI
nr:hypothetical protein [Providencia rettgeri]